VQGAPGAGQAEGQRGLAAVRVLVQVGPHLGQARARVCERLRRVLRLAQGVRRVTRLAVLGCIAGAARARLHRGVTASDASCGVPGTCDAECQLRPKLARTLAGLLPLRPHSAPAERT